MIVQRTYEELSIENAKLKIELSKKLNIEISIKESEEKYRSIIETTSKGFYITDTKGRIKDVNQAYCELSGYSKTELLTLSIADVNVGESKNEIELHLQKIIEIGKDRFETIHKRKNGSFINVEINVTYFSFIESGFVVFIQDITKRKHTEQALKESEEKYRFIADNITDLVWKMDLNTNKITYVSPSVLKNTGYTVEEFTSKKLDELMEPVSLQIARQRLIERSSKLLAGDYSEIISIGEYQMIKKDGSVVWAEISNSFLFDNSGFPVEIIGVSRNIEKRKQAELTINQQNEELTKLNSDKDKFIQILAHDLISPFNSILGYLDLLTNDIREYDIDTIEEQINIVNNSAKSTFKILDDILLWIRTNSGIIQLEPQKLNIGTICNEVIENMKLTSNKKAIKINYFATDDVTIFADKKMIQSLLRNLISNSIKFTNKNGQINIYAAKNHKNATITISDNGIGIEPETLKKLFDISKKTTTKGTANEKGNGLGLLLCKEFVEKHNGKIWIESEIGKGSDVKFTLPLSVD